MTQQGLRAALAASPTGRKEWAAGVDFYPGESRRLSASTGTDGQPALDNRRHKGLIQLIMLRPLGSAKLKTNILFLNQL